LIQKQWKNISRKQLHTMNLDKIGGFVLNWIRSGMAAHVQGSEKHYHIVRMGFQIDAMKSGYRGEFGAVPIADRFVKK
jgi:hypothetical protein